MILKIAGAIFLLIAFVFMIAGKNELSIILLLLSIFSFAVITGLQLSNYFNQRNIKQRRN